MSKPQPTFRCAIITTTAVVVGLVGVLVSRLRILEQELEQTRAELGLLSENLWEYSHLETVRRNETAEWVLPRMLEVLIL